MGTKIIPKEDRKPDEKKLAKKVNKLWWKVKKNFRDEVKARKKQFKEDNPDSEKRRDEKINGNILIKGFVPAVFIGVAIVIVSLIGMWRKPSSIWIWIYFVDTLIVFLFAWAQSKFVSSKDEMERYEKLQEERRKAWNKVLNDTCNGDINSDLFLKLLPFYHKCPLWQRILVVLASALFTAFVVIYTKNIDPNDPVNLVGLIILNIFANFSWGYVQGMLSEDNMYELIKLDMIIE